MLKTHPRVNKVSMTMRCPILSYLSSQLIEVENLWKSSSHQLFKLAKVRILFPALQPVPFEFHLCTDFPFCFIPFTSATVFQVLNVLSWSKWPATHMELQIFLTSISLSPQPPQFCFHLDTCQYFRPIFSSTLSCLFKSGLRDLPTPLKLPFS